MSGATWIKFYPSDWLHGTSVLSPVERGVYITLIAMMYDTGGPLPLNRKALARQCNCTPKLFNDTLASLIEMEKIYEDVGTIFNEKTAKILGVLSDDTEKKKMAANKRWGKTEQNQQNDDANAVQSHSTRNAPAMQTQSTRNAIPDPRSQIIEASKLASACASVEEGPADATIEAELRHAAGWHHDAPKLAHVQPIQDLIAKGLDLHRDVIPLIRQLAPSVKAQTSWKYFIGPLTDILTSRAKEAAAKEGAGQTDEKPGTAVTQFPVYEGTPQFDAWEKHKGQRPFVFDISPGPRLQIRKGFYAPSEWPPGMEPAAAKTEDAA